MARKTVKELIGDVYEGEWIDGVKSGQGTMTYADGTKEFGQWENGEFVG